MVTKKNEGEKAGARNVSHGYSTTYTAVSPMTAKSVRTGVIGLGMGKSHADAIRKGDAPGLALRAVCDSDPVRLAAYDNEPGVRTFDDAHAMMTSGAIDAVIIATPHFSHTCLGMAALRAGLHVLVEKPISVHKPDCRKLLDAHRDPDLVFSTMFQMRTEPRYAKLRAMIRSGDLGTLHRINWIITDWFRSDAYYASGGWRATWAGEGGGVLLNQCPHQLDLWWWLFGMPARVRAFCRFGRYHDIEVEDDVTAYLEYDDHATGIFIATTGEAPGTNRLEVAGDLGKVVIEHGAMQFVRNLESASAYRRTTKEKLTPPQTEVIAVDIEATTGRPAAILANFAAAILEGEPLIAPAADGIHSVELGNAMLLSTFENRTIDLPIDGDAFLRHFDRRVATTRP